MLKKTPKKKPIQATLTFECIHVITKGFEVEVKQITTVLTVVLEVPGCMVLDCMDPSEPREDQVVQEDHVGPDLHVVQEGHVAHPLE